MILPMYILGQPVLRKQAEEITPDYPNLQELISNMYETMKKAEGVGLAAPQIGLPIKLVVIDLDVVSDDMPEYKGFLHAFINPTIIETSEETCQMEEGCLSVPGVHESVKRPKRIHVKYLDENLTEHDEWVDGFLARVMQHEFDHLDGVVYTDHLKGLRRQLMAPKLKQLVKGLFRADYKVKPLRK